MGISSRCNGIHLLNHFKQTNIDLDLNYFQVKDYSESDNSVVINQDQISRFLTDKCAWVCTLRIKDSPTFVCYNSKKNDALRVLLDNIDARNYL